MSAEEKNNYRVSLVVESESESDNEEPSSGPEETIILKKAKKAQRKKQAEIREHIESLRHTKLNSQVKKQLQIVGTADGLSFGGMLGGLSIVPMFILNNAKIIFNIPFGLKIAELFTRILDTFTSRNINLGKIKDVAFTSLETIGFFLAIGVPSLIPAVNLFGFMAPGAIFVFSIVGAMGTLRALGMGIYYRIKSRNKNYPKEEREKFVELSKANMEGFVKALLATTAIVSMLIFSSALSHTATIAVGGLTIAAMPFMAVSATVMALFFIYKAVKNVVDLVNTKSDKKREGISNELKDNIEKAVMATLTATALVLLCVFAPPLGIAAMIGVVAAIAIGVPVLVRVGRFIGGKVIDFFKDNFSNKPKPKSAEDSENEQELLEKKKGFDFDEILENDAKFQEKQNLKKKLDVKEKTGVEKNFENNAKNKYDYYGGFFKPVTFTSTAIINALEQFDQDFNQHHFSPNFILPILENAEGEENRPFFFNDKSQDKSQKAQDKKDALAFLQDYRNKFGEILRKNFDKTTHHLEVDGIARASIEIKGQPFRFKNIEELTLKIEQHIDEKWGKAYQSSLKHVGDVQSLFQQAHNILFSAEATHENMSTKEKQNKFITNALGTLNEAAVMGGDGRGVENPRHIVRVLAT